ncbi:MAG: DNA repair protein RecN [Treponema sp.]|nr:DNA repair protein RecN [Treponema sp.]
MIEEISIRNFALIDSLTLSFDKGFTVLTGETGAGKSIIVGSLSFLLGAKADVDIIRTGSNEASVSAIIYIDDKNTDALSWLSEREIELDDSRLSVRRTIKSTGRSSIFIQSASMTRNDLEVFMGFLFDLHGQHNHESLLRKDTHRVYLDRFSALEDKVKDLNRVFIELSEKRKALEALFTNERDREARLEILNYAIEEITKAAPKIGEIKELESESSRLGDFEKLSGHVNSGASSLFDDDPSLLTLARRSRAAMENASSIDGSLSPLLKRLEDLYYEAEDISSEFRDYRNSLSYDPKRLEEVEERLSLLYKLRKKYRPSGNSISDSSSSDESGVLKYMTEAALEIEALSGAVENQTIIKNQIAGLEKDLTSKASFLSAERKEGAKKLNKGITEILKRLGMPNAAFSAQVLSKGKDRGFVCGPYGADDIEFMFSANTGEPLKDLSRIASGGELSRVMLAIKTILCGNGDSGAETLVFDEVDTGIGGEVALSVGEYLSLIGKEKQIFCVTHLASIAVRADNHLLVQKKVDRKDAQSIERTITGITSLYAEERRLEIARMLAGDSGDAALAHADELLAKYGKS